MTGKKGVLCFSCMILIPFLGFGIAPSAVLAADEAAVYGLIESFVWREFDDAGARLLKESGPLFGVGISFRHMDEGTLTVKLRGEIFGGQVDYDGQACDIWGNCFPLQSNTNYFGFKGEGDLGQKLMVTENSSLEPFAGVGLRRWVRDILSTSAASGATEIWTSLYFRLGLRGDHDFPKDTKGFIEASVKLPIYNVNAADNNISLRPGKKASLYAEAGMKADRVKISAFYEGMRFSKSNVVTTVSPPYIIDHWQPKSKADIYGITVGVAF